MEGGSTKLSFRGKWKTLTGICLVGKKAASQIIRIHKGKDGFIFSLTMRGTLRITKLLLDIQVAKGLWSQRVKQKGVSEHCVQTLRKKKKMVSDNQYPRSCAQGFGQLVELFGNLRKTDSPK